MAWRTVTAEEANILEVILKKKQRKMAVTMWKPEGFIYGHTKMVVGDVQK